MGKAGAGKSSLVNFLLDAPIAHIGEYNTGTFDVNTYKINKYNKNFVIYDTPGLFDVNIDMNQVTKRIGAIEKINIVLICYDISQPRLFRDDVETFEKIKMQYGTNILKHSLLVFTKSNLVGNNLEQIATARYNKINVQIPTIFAHDNTTLEWREVLWDQIVKQSKNSGYMINANYLRYTLCDPMNRIVHSVKSKYPLTTQEKVTEEYYKCVEKQKQEADRQRSNENSFLGFLSFFATIIVGMFTGGIGLVASAGIGLIGNTIMSSSQGLANGIAFIQAPNNDCWRVAETSSINIINSQHLDTYKYQTGQIAYSGYFFNNLPSGKGTVYDEFGAIIWSGNFNMGVPDVCKNIIY